MFRAIGRYLRAVALGFTGAIDRVRKRMLRNPNVMRASFDEIIEDQQKAIIQYKDVLGDQVRRQEQKIDILKRVTREVTELEKHRQGSAYMAKERVALLKSQGKTATEIEADEEYTYCFDHFNRCSTKLDEKQQRIPDLEEDIESLATQISQNERTLQRLHAELSELKEEAEDAVIEVIAANQEQKKADAITGLSEDRYVKQLAEMREVRQKARADARVSAKLADLDTQEAKQKFLDYATSGVARKEFKDIVGLSEPEALMEAAREAEGQSKEVVDATEVNEGKLPE